MRNQKASIIEFSERVGTLIRQGRTEEAQEALAHLVPESKEWRRLKAHYCGKISLVEGDFNKGCQQLEETLIEEGPHILIYADLVAGYYMAKQYTKWKLAIEDLHREFAKCSGLLHAINRYRVKIILAKSLELNGSIMESYRIFKTMREVPEIDFRIKALTNLVRLEAQYPISTNFSRNYLMLKPFSLKNEQKEFDYDVLHSLLLAEAEHIDIESAQKTLEFIPKNEPCFYALGYYELLDIWLRHDSTAYDQMLKKFSYCAPKTLSDERLLLLLTETSISNWYTWINDIPLSQYLRLLRFLLPKLSQKDRDICVGQVKIYLQGLSSISRQIWLDFLKKDGVEQNEKMFVKFVKDNTSCIVLNDVEIDFRRQKLVSKLVQLIMDVNETSISYQAVSQSLWGCDLDEFVSDRIRQLVNRVNRLTKQKANVNLISSKEDSLKLIPSRCVVEFGVPTSMTSAPPVSTGPHNVIESIPGVRRHL